MKIIFFCAVIFLAAKNLIETNKKDAELNLNFFQNDYQVKFERAVLVSYNKEYLKDAKLLTFKFNRTQAVINMTMTPKVDFGNSIEYIMQAFKFTSNEYREFPLRFQANLCKLLAANAAGAQKALKCGNFTGCPIAKGKTFHICNFFPDQSKLPPFIPNGEFKLEIQAVYFSTEICVFDVYFTVFRPIRLD